MSASRQGPQQACPVPEPLSNMSPMKSLSPWPLRRWTLALAVLLAEAAGATPHTPHSFAVTESGAATLSLPIQVPRGIGGMEPQLALNYSSQAGNGLLGLGWNLSGPSAITRCPKTRAIDGVRGSVSFSAETDRYCLDGLRLELQSGSAYGADGSTYVTERDNFAVITAVGSFESQSNVPASFRVETKAGLILHFGLSDNSRVRTNLRKSVRDAGKKDTVNRWMLQRIADLHGSFVEFVYCGGTVTSDGTTCKATENTFSDGTSNWSGSKVLRYIQYTNTDGAANGTFAVVLRYANRPDAIEGLHAGSASYQGQRISAIQTYRGFVPPAANSLDSAATLGTLIRSYDITYDPEVDSSGNPLRASNVSRIINIQERDEAGNTLSPLKFTYPPDLVFGKKVKQNN